MNKKPQNKTNTNMCEIMVMFFFLKKKEQRNKQTKKKQRRVDHFQRIFAKITGTK